MWMDNLLRVGESGWMNVVSMERTSERITVLMVSASISPDE